MTFHYSLHGRDEPLRYPLEGCTLFELERLERARTMAATGSRTVTGMAARAFLVAVDGHRDGSYSRCDGRCGGTVAIAWDPAAATTGFRSCSDASEDHGNL